MKRKEELAKYCSYKIGGPADYYVEPSNEKELLDAINFAEEQSLPLFFLGRGSNLLISDSGFPGVVINLSSLSELIIEETTVDVQCGMTLSGFVLRCAREGLGGLERLAGIPGTLGGGVMMNAGAYGTEICEKIRSVKWYDRVHRKVVESSVDELSFGYRWSSFKENKGIVLSTQFQLEATSAEDLLASIEETQAKRKKSQPLTYPSCGSVFKRPEGNYAGALIEASGLKGFTIGRAQVSEKHANFIINRGGATAEDVLALISHCRKTVFAESKILLEPEVIMVGTFSQPVWSPENEC